MATGIEEWLFGYVGSKLADKMLGLIRGSKLTSDLHKAVGAWASELPPHATLASTNALFPSHVPDSDLTGRPYLAELRSLLRNSNVPTKECWHNALLEQWRFVRATVPEHQAFFILSEDIASKLLEDLAIRLCSICSQQQDLFRPTAISLLRDVEASSKSKIPTDLIDQIIEVEVEKLRKSRFFAEYDRSRSALNLGKRIVTGNLQAGSIKVRRSGLAWCARVLSLDVLDQAEELFEQASALGPSEETRIANAFIVAQKGDKVSALQTISGINTDVSRSARLMIVTHHDGFESALTWMEAASYTVDGLDSDGKYFFLLNQLLLGKWDDGAKTVNSLSDADFANTPIFHHLTAVVILASTVPVGLKESITLSVPFDSHEFPLASNTDAMAARRAAHKHFLEAVEADKNLACPNMARIDDEFALWLELRDPEQSEHGKKRLVGKLNDPNIWLGFIRYALDFSIAIELDKVERAIEQSVAINGRPSIDTAIARYSLAFKQPTAEMAANYIVRHQDEMSAHRNSSAMQYRLIELYSSAGMIEKAKDVFNSVLKDGVSTELESKLQRIIVEAQGTDPVESRKAQYERTNAVDDLMNLVVKLEDLHRWDDLCIYGKRLFDATHSLSDAKRLVNAYNKMDRSEALVMFLKENSDLLAHSQELRTTYAWALYYEGAFVESRAALTVLGDVAGSPNYRALQVNLAIATGDWGGHFCLHHKRISK